MGLFSKGNTAAKSASGTTLIASGTCLQGSLELGCNLHVDGEVKGDIDCKATVCIGKTGKVSGQINAQTLIVSGYYDGYCQTALLEITKTGQVEGEVQAEQLIIAKGGSFNGRCSDMSAPTLPEIAQLHPEKSASKQLK